MNPCGNQTKHTSRVGCCGGCKRLFSSDTAFMRHRRHLECADPGEVGLVARPSKSHPDETIWSLPSDGRNPHS